MFDTKELFLLLEKTAMSIVSARIVCTGCGYEILEVYRPVRIRYQTTNGRIVETGCARGWCYNCGNYSDIERMNKEELYAELLSKKRERLEARRRQEDLSHGFLCKFRHRHEKKKLQDQLEWLNKEIAGLCELLEIAGNRKSKSRCLTCWTDRTELLKFDPESNIAHNYRHECGGNLQIIYDDSGPRFNFRVATYVLNEEGELLKKE